MNAKAPTERRIIWSRHPRADVGHFRYSLTPRAGRLCTVLERFDGVRWSAATTGPSR